MKAVMIPGRHWKNSIENYQKYWTHNSKLITRLRTFVISKLKMIRELIPFPSMQNIVASNYFERNFELVVGIQFYQNNITQLRYLHDEYLLI